MPTSPTQSPLTHKPQFGISQFGPLQRGKQKQASVPLLAEPTAPCPLQIEFSGKGTDEIATIASISGDKAPALKVGDVIMRIDLRYFRPAEVETLLGDPSKARAKLGWEPEITAREMCAEMVAADLKEAQRHAFLKANGFELPVSFES